MSQNRDETGEPRDTGSQAQNEEFESELDYGAFASDEPDFPEDRLEQEPAPQDRPEADQSAAAPVAEGVQAAGASDDQQTRSLSEELAAAKSAGSADRIEAAESATSTAPAAADEQATTTLPPAEESHTTALPHAAPAPAAHPSQAGPPEDAPAAPPPAARHSTANDEITSADIDEEVTKAKRGVSRFFSVLIAIFTPLLFIVAAVRLVGTPVFLWATYARPGFPADPHGFGMEERMLYGSYGMDFLFNLANYQYLADLTGPDGEALFTSEGSDLNEISHMVDVKQVIWLVMLIGLGLLVLTVLFALLLRSWRPGSFARGLFAGAWATIALMVTLAVLAILDWRMFFEEFHALFFDGNWAFPDDYTLIRLYPTQFWMDAGIWIAALLLIFSIVTLLATWPTKRRRARRADRLAEVQDRRRQKLIKELNSASANS